MTAAAINERNPAARRPRVRRRWSRWLLGLAVIAAYPLFVFGYAYAHSLASDFPGPRHGPQDAYRHALASAVLAYTLSPRAVHWATVVMESSDDPSSAMDRHNNAIGASIGASATSFGQLRPLVEQRVGAGRINATDPAQITWLPPRQWSRLPF
jgi:hypothetical protein